MDVIFFQTATDRFVCSVLYMADQRALVRVSNATIDCTVDFLWHDDTHQGRETLYTSLCPGQVHTQQTYLHHRWILRSQTMPGREDQHCVEESFTVSGRESTVYVTKSSNGGIEVTLAGFTLEPLYHLLCDQHPVWGQYMCRATVHGIPICSYSEAVCDHAVIQAVEIIQGMFKDVYTSEQTQKMLSRMIHLGVEVAIIGRDQKTTDIPAHRHLRGRMIHNSTRTFEHDTRGLGATVSCPVMSCPEENLIQSVKDDRYPHESILVHEFAHTVMNLGLLHTELYTKIKESYHAAMRNNMYDAQSYVALNPEEYWAETTQAWFHATTRTDVTSGITTREALIRHDPRLAVIMYEVWGHGSWRFESPREDKGKATPSCFQGFKTCTCM